jgi:hypothetical protein
MAKRVDVDMRQQRMTVNLDDYLDLIVIYLGMRSDGLRGGKISARQRLRREGASGPAPVDVEELASVP